MDRRVSHHEKLHTAKRRWRCPATFQRVSVSKVAQRSLKQRESCYTRPSAKCSKSSWDHRDVGLTRAIQRCFPFLS